MTKLETSLIKMPARYGKPTMPLDLRELDIKAIIEAIKTVIKHEAMFAKIRSLEWEWPPDIEKDSLRQIQKRLTKISEQVKKNLRHDRQHPFLFTEWEVKLLYITLGMFTDFVAEKIHRLLI